MPAQRTTRRRSPEDRFWAKVDKNGPVPEHRPDLGPCWLWTSSIHHGYGYFWRGDKQVRAHRFAYELLVGPIPEPLVPDHLCRVRHCVNPSHLEPVTHRENVLRGEGFSAQFSRRTHCINGHEFTPENTVPYHDAPEARKCLACTRDNTAAAKARRRVAQAQREGRGDIGEAIAMLTVTELARQIDAHLKRFEADPEINEQRAYGQPYYSAGAHRAGGCVQVRYISYQGHTNLKRAAAERYLAWLDAGNVGRHFEALRDA